MNYQQTIQYLFEKLPMFSRMGAAAFKKDLTNTIALCNALHNPQQKFKTIHIAGTNGKGSVSHMLAAVLQTAGYKTGLYTSPHLKDFKERIKVNGALCSEEFIIQFTQKIQPHIETIQPSFFEITVAMAFEYFAQQQVDIAIIETGLGGRLDSTNIITPELSVITNIGYDHMNMLGNALREIALEKAGIIKQNVSVVIGETHKETANVFVEKANETNATIVFADKQRWIADWQYEHHLLNVWVANHFNDEHEKYSLDLNGIYQTKNLLTVLEALHQLRFKGFEIDKTHILHALQHTKKITGLHGRWEVIYQNPTVVLDVAHNEDGIKQVVQQLALINFNQLHIIFGMVKDKAIDNVLEILPKQAYYYFTQAQIERALHAEILMKKAAGYQLTGNFYTNVNIALKEALLNAHKNDLILICGSVFLVGEVE
ncbi:MAG: bifunctional folylpolyglutamate synthase/dihydrofolate synthase [Bacteroidetes bacterium]|nr:bifunctional folylpolyglutamate synthase/dihydrofolate synthase [Bacteroidota bacterium]MBS1648240.1 bifunctional folylpolyglutamate synthase/dihydrofolate synthase [Bacteroidota bacterium]